jgi:uncharacterized membrane protein
MEMARQESNMRCLVGRPAVLHQLAQRYSVYPLVFWTVLAGALLAARIIYSGTHHYGFLLWNLSLAWIPYLASLWAEVEHTRRPGRWRRLVLPGAIWLLFLPNAPYIVTDLIHLSHYRPPVPLWYDAVLIFAFAWTGCHLGVVSLRIMRARVRAWAGTAAAWIFALGAIGLCGPGIYMGRVLRWNSWDVFSRPVGMLHTVLAALVDPLSHWPAIAASLIFAGIMLGCYVTLVMLQSDPAKERAPSRGD